MNTEKTLGDLRMAVSEMIESAVSAKGEDFGSVAAGIFELLQISSTIGAMGEIARQSGVDLSHAVSTCHLALTSVSSRLLLTLKSADAEEASRLAEAMMKKRIKACDLISDRRRS